MSFTTKTISGRPRKAFTLKAPKIPVALIAIGIALFLLRPAPSSLPADDVRIFVVSRTAETADIQEKMSTDELLGSRWLLGPAILLHGGYGRIDPGGYRLTANMGTWAIAGILTADPPLKWVTIPEGLRREQVADRLAKALGWDDQKRERFLLADIRPPYDLSEGFYYPDTYLIPVDEDETLVAKRFINRFNENFAPYVEPLREANIKYDTAIKLASLIQREAGGKHDMALIAGVLWNRLLIKMPLQVDATLQYARGDTGSGYWAPVAVADKKIDSPFNTYLHAGLPPSPIANPGLDAIDAVLHPEETDCLFYLHDNDAQIHCAKTYDGHKENIEKYLRN